MHTQDDIARYLYALSADCTRDSWIKIMSAFKSAGGDYETFRAWSATAPHRFDESDCNSAWNSITPSGNSEGAAGMLRKWAKETGATFDDQPSRARKAPTAPTAPPPPPPIPGAIPPPPPMPSPGNTPRFSAATTKGKEISPQTIIKRAAELRAEALPYLEKRGITADTAERFNIGFIRRFEEAGTIEDRIIIPYPGEPYYTARRLSKANAGDRKKYLYPPKEIAGEKRLFNLPALTNGEKAVFITEGPIDAITLEQSGGAAIASNDPGQIKAAIDAAIEKEIKLTVETFIIIPDEDRTGEQKAKKKLETLKEAGFQAYIYHVPAEYHDINDFFLKAGTDAFSAWMLGAKCPLLQYCIDFADVQDETPELPPLLIHDYLRCGEKMLIAGPSKAGKTWFLIQMALAISTGGSWYGNPCEKAPVLYFNLELKTNAFRKRVIEVSKRLGIRINRYMLHIANLCDFESQYKSDLTLLISSIIELARTIKARAIFIDPIYKCGLKDENSAEDVAEFCRLLDEITDETGAAVIYCHHFSKGIQFEKSSIDRASGSGVFARDADAIATITELDTPDGSKGYRVEATLRGFKTPEPFAIRFEYPIHAHAPDLKDCPLKNPKRQGKKTASADQAVEEEAAKKVILDLAATLCPLNKTKLVEAVAPKILRGKNRAGDLIDQLIKEKRLICKTDKGHFNSKTITLPKPDETDEESDEESDGDMF